MWGDTHLPAPPGCRHVVCHIRSSRAEGELPRGVEARLLAGVRISAKVMEGHGRPWKAMEGEMCGEMRTCLPRARISGRKRSATSLYFVLRHSWWWASAALAAAHGSLPVAQ